MYKLIPNLLFLILFTMAACTGTQELTKSANSTNEVTPIQDKSYSISDAEIEYIRTDDKSEVDNTLESMISPYRKDMEEQMDVVIGKLDQDLVKSRPHSNLSNWFCDALHEEAERLSGHEVDFAIQNYGGLRIPSVAKGDLTKGKIYELMPFDNMLILIDLDGATVFKLVNNMAKSGGWPISKGLSFKITEDGEAQEIKIKGQNFDESKTYKVAMPDYVANGGDNASFLKHFKQDNLGFFIRDAIIENVIRHSKNGEPLKIDTSKRIFK